MDNIETKYNITINNVYEGPMELLLDLIKKNEIDIYDIPIAKLTEKFIEEIGEIRFENLESFLEFSFMAATLLQIKSKMLLPINEDEENDEIDPREELVNRLIEYNYYKEISTILKSYFNIGNKKIQKNSEDLTILAMEENIDFKDMNIDSLSKLFSKMLHKSYKDEIDFEFNINYESITMEEGITYLESKLVNDKKFYFSSLFDVAISRLEIITFFLSVLELIKSKKITVTQSKIHEDILIEKYE